MTIIRAQFDNERELQEWTSANLSSFFPGAFYVPGCQVTTSAGKAGAECACRLTSAAADTRERAPLSATLCG